MAGRKHTQEQVGIRRQEVETALSSGQWSRQVAAGLAERWAVSIRQIFRDRASVLEAWKKEHAGCDVGLERARILEEMRGVRARCVQMGLKDDSDSKLIAQVVNLFRLEVEVLGLADPARIEVDVAIGDPAQMAAEVVAGLPMLGSLLGMKPKQLIEAAYEAAEE